MDVGALVASVLASVATVAGGYLVARRYQKLGGDDAQTRLNAIRKDLDDAMTEKLRVLGEDFVACKDRLREVEAKVKRMSDERRDLKQDVADLHAEIRDLQRGGNQDARDVRQEGRAIRQDKRQIRQDDRQDAQDDRDG